MSAELSFAGPLWLLLLPLPWLPQLLSRRLRAWRKRPGARERAADTPVSAVFPLRHLIPEQHPPDVSGARPGSRQRLRGLFAALGLTALIVALAEPVRVGQRLPDPPPQRDIVFIVDTSIAMVLRDYSLDGDRVDRMTLLKTLLTRFVDGLQGERMAVIVFGERAYTLVPLTRDTGLVKAQVARIRGTMAGRFNAAGEAIALAVREATTGQAAARRRVLVLLSAAGSPSGAIDARAAAELASEHGLPLYTIVIGAPRRGAGPAADETGSAGLIYRPAGAARMETLATLGGGSSFVATDSAAVGAALAAIQARESNPGEPAVSRLQQPLYQWPLLCGLLLLTLAEFTAPRGGRCGAVSGGPR